MVADKIAPASFHCPSHSLRKCSSRREIWALLKRAVYSSVSVVASAMVLASLGGAGGRGCSIVACTSAMEDGTARVRESTRGREGLGTRGAYLFTLHFPVGWEIVGRVGRGLVPSTISHIFMGLNDTIHVLLQARGNERSTVLAKTFLV